MATVRHRPNEPDRWPAQQAEPPFVALCQRDGLPVMSGQGTASLGTRFGPAADGVHAGWTWDGARLTAQVDTHGFYTLFYCIQGDRVMLSPSLLHLVAQGADTTPDARARAVFYHMGLFINGDTPFRHIRALPPAGRLVWQDGKAAVTGAAYVPAERQIKRPEIVDGFIDLTRQSLRRIFDAWPADFVLPLSGGRDSRHILLEMAHLGRLPASAVTFHHQGAVLNAEALSARAVAERAGVEHVVLGHPRPRTTDILRTLLLTSLCSDEHMQMMPLHDYLGTVPGAALDGIAGDILSNPDDWADDFFHLAAKGDYRGIALGMIDGHGRVTSKPHWARGAGPIHAPGMQEEVLDYVGAAIAEFADAPDPYQCFWFWNRTRREIGLVPSALFGTAEAVFCPFLDPDLVRFCLSLPYAEMRDQLMHDEALAKAYPAYADIPFQDGFRRPAPPQRRHPLRKAVKAAQALRVMLAAGPDHPVAEAVRLVRGSDRLHRGPGEANQLHAICLEGMDAAKARRLLALAARLDRDSNRDLVTDVLPRQAV